MTATVTAGDEHLPPSMTHNERGEKEKTVIKHTSVLSLSAKLLGVKGIDHCFFFVYFYGSTCLHCVWAEQGQHVLLIPLMFSS